MSNIELVPTFIIHINGSRLPIEREADVKEITVSNRLNSLSSFVIKVSDPAHDWINNDDYGVGAEVKIQLGYKDAVGEVISGEVTSVEHCFNENQPDMVILKGNDHMHRFGRQVLTRQFTEKTDKEIIEQIAGEYGLSTEIEDLNFKHLFALQLYQTDYQLLSHMAERYDCKIWVKDKKLYFNRPVRNAGEDVVLEYGKTLKEVNAISDTSGIITEVEVRGWDRKNCESIIGTATFEEIESTGGSLVNEKWGAAKEIHIDNRLEDIKGAEELALDLLTRKCRDYMTGKAVCQGNKDIVAGTIVKLEGLGNKFSGCFLVTDTSHLFRAGDSFETRFSYTENLAAPSNAGTSSSGGQPVVVSGDTSSSSSSSSSSTSSGLTDSEEPETEKAPAITNLKWFKNEEETTEAAEGDVLLLSAEVTDIADGTKARITLYKKEHKDENDFVKRENVTVEEGKIEWEWPAEYYKPANAKELTQKDDPPPAEYLFSIEVTQPEKVKSEDSPVLKVEPHIEDVYFIEVPDIHFHHNSAVPCLDNDEYLIKALTTAFRFAEKNTVLEMVILGHADTSGNKPYNYSISGMRGEAVKAILKQDETAWKSIVQQKSKVEDRQQILKTLHDVYKWKCDPGEVNNVDSPETKAAVKDFQIEANGRYKLGLQEDGIIGPKTWAAILKVYGFLIKKQYSGGDENAALPSIKYDYSKGKGVYECGESFPKEESGRDDYKSQENRRVELFFADFKKVELKPATDKSRDLNSEECPIYGPYVKWEKINAEEGTVDTVSTEVEIKAENGTDDPAPHVLKEDTEKFKAIPKYPGGTYKWKVTGNIEIVGSDSGEIVEIKGVTMSGAKEDSELTVDYTNPDGTGTATHKITVANLAIKSVPTHFAPSAENCKIEYNLGFEGITSKEMAKLIIQDRDGTEIFTKNDLPLEPESAMVYEWDGKDKTGKYQPFLKAPYKIMIEIKGKPAVKSEEKSVKVEIKSITIELKNIDTANNRMIMNKTEVNGGSGIEAHALVKLKKTSGAAAITEVPVDVDFTFSDPGTANTNKVDSFSYSAGKNLGKAGDASAVLWKKHTDCNASSSDSYNTKCKITTLTTSGHADLGKAKVHFLPSGVGGDDYKIKAEIFDADGTTSLASKEADAFKVWRKVKFDKIYEMTGETHASTNSTDAIICPYYDPAFVLYEAGNKVTIDAVHSVDYVDLWKSAATPQESWATLTTKKATETPTAAEITAANYTGTDATKLAQRATARTAIIAKAQAWVDRIDTARNVARNKWLTDSGIPTNCIIGIRYFHPKYSNTADTNTTEWRLGGAATPAWLRVTAFSGNYTNLDPDGIWVNGGQWGGLSIGNGRIMIPNYLGAATIKKVVAHEAGHATKSYFHRDVFGPSLDHSASNAGIMYKDTSGGNSFTTREKKILRGIVP